VSAHLDTVNGLLAAAVVVLAGLLGYALRLLFAGRLVPRSHVEDWIEAYRTSEAARAEERRQTEELLGLVRNIHQQLMSRGSVAS